MPNFNIVKEINPKETFRVASIKGKFDLQTAKIKEEFIGNIDLKNDWNIGLIVGNSGTGKTVIAKQLFQKEYIQKFNYKKESVIDEFPKEKSIEDISNMLNSVGFSSPPSWLKPYNVLSNGEKMRVDLAMALLDDKPLIVFDEFTSVVDRTVARIGSFTTQKVIRKTNKKFIAVTCHHDVEKWLMPNWVFDTNEMKFTNTRRYLRRPKIKIKIYETKEKSKYWEMFAKYHYLNKKCHRGADVYVLTLDDVICGFCSVLHFPHPKVKNLKRIHRLVIKPDFQGLSLGIFLMNYVTELYIKKGFRISITTSQPSLIFKLKQHGCWRLTHKGRNKNHKGLGVNIGSQNRITTSWEYKKQKR